MEMKNTTSNEFNEIISKFESNEERGAIYWRAKTIIQNNPEYTVDACLLLLTTWNFAHLSSILKKSRGRSFNYERIKKTTEIFLPIIKKLDKENIKDCNLDLFKEDIEKAYMTLYDNEQIRGIGASKVLMLLNDNLFVAWDNAIIKWYSKGLNRGKKIKQNRDYFSFLKLMQNNFRGITLSEKNQNVCGFKRGLAKAIDEYNFQMAPRQKNKDKLL